MVPSTVTSTSISRMCRPPPCRAGGSIASWRS